MRLCWHPGEIGKQPIMAPLDAGTVHGLSAIRRQRRRRRRTIVRRVRFGFKTPQQHTSYADMLALWQEADTIPVLEHGWLFDHLNPVDTAAAAGPEIVGP